MKDDLLKYVLFLGDNSMILAHRLSECCGHGPTLETDIALTNISLDLFGEVRSYFQYAGKLSEDEKTEDDFAFLRTERNYYNLILTEQPNEDFAHVIVRQFLFDNYHYHLLEQLVSSKDETIAAISQKSIKEAKYHLRFSSEWMKRLGDGTSLSQEKTQMAFDKLYLYVEEFFIPSNLELVMQEKGIGADLSIIKKSFESVLEEVISEAKISLPQTAPRVCQGKQGVHTENLGYLLAEFQYMQRTYPNMTW